jgi:peptide/nickel transport system ATP-binding protein
VLITHNMGVVADLADRVAVMLNGEVVETAPARSCSPPRRTTTRSACWPPCRAWRSSTGSCRRAAEAAPVVVAEDLVIEYAGRLRRAGFRAVDRVSFSIAPGEVVGLVGESGSGKTTIGRAIAGLTPVTGGSLRVLGVEMNGVKERTFRPHRKDLGFVFQDPATSFNPLLTIAQNVAEPLIVHGGARDAADARDRVDELLEAVQLPKAFGDRFPHELSGGQRQRARWPAASPSTRSCSSPTSPPARSTCRCRRACSSCSASCRSGSGSRPCSSRTISRSSTCSPTGSSCCTRAPSPRPDRPRGARRPQDDYTRKLIASLPVPDPVSRPRAARPGAPHAAEPARPPAAALRLRRVRARAARKRWMPRMPPSPSPPAPHTVSRATAGVSSTVLDDRREHAQRAEQHQQQRRRSR